MFAKIQKIREKNFFSNYFEFLLICTFLQKVEKFTKILNILQTIFCLQKGLLYILIFMNKF